MNLFTVILVFHVLRLNLCVALNQVCPERQFLNSSGVCVDCTVCEQLDKQIILRPCSAHGDTLCGSISDININLPGIKRKPAYQNDLSDQYVTINTDADLSRNNIADILKKLSEPEKSTSAAKGLLDTSSFYYYDDEDDSEEDVEYEDDKDNNTSNSTAKSSSSSIQTVKNKPSSIQELLTESAKKQIKKIKSKPTKLSLLPEMLNNAEVSVLDPDTLIQKTKKLRKLKLNDNSAESNDQTLKIGDTKFNIGSEISDDGRWLQLSHPHIVDKKIYVDLEQNTVVNKKGSTFFSSGEIQTDQEYAIEMSKLLNETSSVLNEKPTTVHNQTIQINTQEDDDDNNNNNELKNLDDNDNSGDDEDDDDDDDDEDEDEDEDEDDEDEDEDDDEAKENVDDDDESSIYNDFVSSNNSDRTDSVEKTDFDTDDDYYSQENDFYKDRIDVQQSNKYITSEPFVSTANWQILILVAAMSACLLFFIVVSGYICIYMRKRRHIKTTFVADIEDISVRVNLMQHAGFETDDSNNIKNYISHLKGVKSTHETLPKIYARSK